MTMTSTREAMLSQSLSEDGTITVQDYENLLIKVRKLQRENRKLRKALEEYQLYEDDEIA